MPILPDNDKNIVGKAKQDNDVMHSADWQAAKENADFKAAGRVVDLIWSDKKTQQLRDVLKNIENVIFITQPSTSRNNVVPIALAQRLSQDLQGKYIDGDDYFETLHRQQSKHIPSYRRVFERREYEMFDLSGLKEQIGGKKVVVVEDILTTGGSVAAFIDHLNYEGIKVESITALMGDKRLQIDQKTFEKLDSSLKNNSIPINSTELARHITRAEAGGLIMVINSARSENAREKLTRNLQGIFDNRPYKDVGRDQVTTGYKEPQGSDKGNESIAERIQAWEIRGKSGLISYHSQKDNFLKALESSTDKGNEKEIVKDVSKGIEY